VLHHPYLGRIYNCAEDMHTNRQEGLYMQLLILLIWLSSIIIIFYAFFRAFSLKEKIPGGLAKQTWKLLYYITGILCVGYLTLPLFPTLPESSRDIIVAVVSLAGAVFILKALNLFHEVLKDVGL
jgi:hypothetical protein